MAQGEAACVSHRTPLLDTNPRTRGDHDRTHAGKVNFDEMQPHDPAHDLIRCSGRQGRGKTMTKSPRRLKQQFQETVGEQCRRPPAARRHGWFHVRRSRPGPAYLGPVRAGLQGDARQGGGVKPVLGRLRDERCRTPPRAWSGGRGSRVRGEEAESASADAAVRRTRSGPAAAPTAGTGYLESDEAEARRRGPGLGSPGPGAPPKRAEVPDGARRAEAGALRRRPEPEPEAKAADTPKTCDEGPLKARGRETRTETPRRGGLARRRP